MYRNILSLLEKEANANLGKLNSLFKPLSPDFQETALAQLEALSDLYNKKNTKNEPTD
jgi:hypothetical protein